MATRCSPRLKGSPKPELPHKPRPPKRVQNAAEDSVRQANFQVELAEWQQAKAEHDKLMQNRKRKQNAATKAAARKAASSPAPRPLSPRPRSCQLILAKRVCQLGSSADRCSSSTTGPWRSARILEAR